jgi:uncharacterized protein
MRLLIISDTHGNHAAACQAAQDAAPVDWIIHLGDVVADIWAVEAIADCPVIGVAGNCDHVGAGVPREIIRDFAGVPFLLTHGDAYQVKAGLTGLHARAMQEEARVVLYGHTHRAEIDEIDGILFINPGTLNPASATKTYAIVDIVDGTVRAGIISLSDHCGSGPGTG